MRIEPEVGDVATSGSAVVQPAKSTEYTLIAWNDAGDVTATQLFVVPRRWRAVRH